MKKYRILPLLLIVCLLLTAAFPAAAAKNTADNSADTPQSTANVSSDGVPQSTVQAAEGSYVLGSDAVKSCGILYVYGRSNANVAARTATFATGICSICAPPLSEKIRRVLPA